MRAVVVSRIQCAESESTVRDAFGPPLSQLTTATSYSTFIVCLPLTYTSSDSNCHDRFSFVATTAFLIVSFLVPTCFYFFSRGFREIFSIASVTRSCAILLSFFNSTDTDLPASRLSRPL